MFLSDISSHKGDLQLSCICIDANLDLFFCYKNPTPPGPPKKTQHPKRKRKKKKTKPQLDQGRLKNFGGKKWD